METINSRNKLNLYWAKKISIIVAACFLCFKGFSQTTEHRNLPNYDNKFLHYGFSVGTNYSIYRLSQTDYFANQKSISSVRSVGTYSFSLGFILNMRLAEFFDLRLLPTVAFYQRKINYKSQIEDIIDPSFIFESSFIELPLLLKYKAQRRGNHRMYMVGGLKAGFEVGGKKGEKKDDPLRTTGKDLSIEAGFGLDIYNELFKFSPELRFSVGLLNLNQPLETEYSRVINRLSTYTVSLYFFFE